MNRRKVHPRARGRRRWHELCRLTDRRSTRARAEETRTSPAPGRGTRVHPRARGRDTNFACPWSWYTGPPARARKRPLGDLRRRLLGGSTRARAKETLPPHRRVPACRVHPRARGRDSMERMAHAGSAGPPARARKRQGHHRLARLQAGSTRARAEETQPMRPTPP